MALVEDLIESKVLYSDAVIKAFRVVPRDLFLPDGIKELTEENVPLPIGHGQTNSQPLTVAFMLELLGAKEGETVLDVGFGSGWTTALLAEIVGDTGKVVAVEIVPELFQQGRANIDHAGYSSRVECLEGDWLTHVSGDQVYAQILASASALAVPAELKLALKNGGHLVMPVEEGTRGDHVVVRLTRENDHFSREDFPGFQFVPLV